VALYDFTETWRRERISLSGHLRGRYQIFFGLASAFEALMRAERSGASSVWTPILNSGLSLLAAASPKRLRKAIACQ
jgi:hypothetical protein